MKVLIVLLMSIPVLGCGPVLGPKTSPADVVKAHIEAMNQEDLEQAMSYIDDDGPNYAVTRTATEKVFKDYDIRYSVEVLGYVDKGDKDEKRVKVIQETRKIAGPAFVDNRMTAYYVLREDWFGWKITGTEVLSVEPLLPTTP